MAVLEIITRDDPRLFIKAKKVPKIDTYIKKLLNDMVDTMNAADGIGLAAPQVGIGLKLIVMKCEEKIYKVINPQLLETSEEILAVEGCLSIPGYSGTTRRFLKASIKGLDEKGKPVRIKAEGLLAHIIQHELDHLEGRLYITRLESEESFKKLVPKTTAVEVESERETS